MFQARVFAFAINIEAGLFRFEIFVANLNQRVLLNIVAQFFTLFNLFREPRETFRIKSVGGIEILHVGLVKISERDRLKLQAVLEQIFFHRFAYAFDKSTALFVQFLHGHFRRDGA